MIHCRNTGCKFYWEDICTQDLENKMVVIDGYGSCDTFEEGKSNYYNENEIDTNNT